MSSAVHCSRCGDESPPDAQFCIECGATLVPSATGPTMQLTTLPCPGCSTNNPNHARFCVRCGMALVPGVTPLCRTPAPKVAPQHVYRRVASPPMPVHVQAPALPAPQRTYATRQAQVLIFLGGLFLLFLTETFWPGILVLIGISRWLHHSERGRSDKELSSLVWWLGLALLFFTDTFWPGILLLIGVLHLIGRPRRHRCW